MGLDKDALKADLIDWFTRGANDEFNPMPIGISYFMNIVKTWGENASDSLGNKIQSFDAVPITVALLTLVPTDLTAIPATQLADGAINCFKVPTLKQIEDTTTPPLYQSTISHELTGTPSLSSIQTKFKAILDTDFASIMALAVPPTDPNAYLREYLAGEWADVLTDVAEGCSWIWQYVQDIPPAYPTATLTGNLS